MVICSLTVICLKFNLLYHTWKKKTRILFRGSLQFDGDLPKIRISWSIPLFHLLGGFAGLSCLQLRLRFGDQEPPFFVHNPCERRIPYCLYGKETRINGLLKTLCHFERSEKSVPFFAFCIENQDFSFASSLERTGQFFLRQNLLFLFGNCPAKTEYLSK